MGSEEEEGKEGERPIWLFDKRGKSTHVKKKKDSAHSLLIEDLD